MSEMLAALLIGCGRIAGGLNASAKDEMVLTHALAYRRHPRFMLAACVDPDTKTRADFMARWDIAKGFSSLDEALASGMKFDVASVASPTSEHIGQLRKLLTSPVRAVFAEKPLGGDPAAAKKIADAYTKVRKPLVVAYLRRFDPSMNALKDEIARGDWGKIEKAVAIYGRGVMNNGSHAVDLVGYLTGSAQMEIATVNGSLDDGVPGDPTVDATLRLANGALFHLAGVDGSKRGIFEILIQCESGLISIEESGLKLRRRRIGEAPPFAGAPRLLSAEEQATGYGEAFLKALDAVLLAMDGKPAQSDGRSALAAISICDALRRRI